MTLFDPTYRLARDGRHAYLGEAGAFIGAGGACTTTGAVITVRGYRVSTAARLGKFGSVRSV